jgi:broad specificity phosphatase PhoE
MEVIFIRHSESFYNIGKTDNLDSEITYNGKKQALFLGRHIKNNFDLTKFKGFVSPYFRTLQTAEILSRYAGLNFSVNSNIREFNIYVKDLPFLTDRSLQYPIFNWEDVNLSLPQEHLEDFFIRMEDFLLSLEDNGKYIIVSHGAPCRVMIELLTGGDLELVRHRYLNKTVYSKTTDGIKNCDLIWVKNEEIILTESVYTEPLISENGFRK